MGMLGIAVSNTIYPHLLLCNPEWSCSQHTVKLCYPYLHTCKNLHSWCGNCLCPFYTRCTCDQSNYPTAGWLLLVIQQKTVMNLPQLSHRPHLSHSKVPKTFVEQLSNMIKGHYLACLSLGLFIVHHRRSEINSAFWNPRASPGPKG